VRTIDFSFFFDAPSLWAPLDTPLTAGETLLFTDPAWKSKPSFYLVATQDGMIPPPAQRMMAERAGATVREEAGSHAIYVSKPQPVADIIEAAAG
jgi:pimeloyl-ACP methyl ester carboxylesterase